MVVVAASSSSVGGGRWMSYSPDGLTELNEGSSPRARFWTPVYYAKIFSPFFSRLDGLTEGRGERREEGLFSSSSASFDDLSPSNEP